MTPRSDNGSHGLRHAGDDAFQLTVDYLKQETVEPLKGLGRFLYMGIAGSFCLAFGILLILIGVLRLLQTETGTALDRGLSWVPYAVVFVLGHRRHRRGRLAHHRRAGAAKLPEVVARREARLPSHRRERADAGTTTTKAGSNGRLITREDLQAAYAQVMGEGEARPAPLRPGGWPSPAPSASWSSRWPSSPAGAAAAPSRRSSRSGGSDMDVLLRRFLRAGVRRGLAGNWYWFLLAGATFFLRRVLNDRSSAVSSVTVSPGRAGAHHGARPQGRARRLEA